MAPEDPTGKCQNCVRLKKDCNFFPVDQHPVLDRRPRSGSKLEASSNEAGTSDSSSPGMSGGRSVDRVDSGQNAIPPLPHSATLPPSIGARPFEDPLHSPPGRGAFSTNVLKSESTNRDVEPLTSRSYDHAHNMEPGHIWSGPTYLQQSPQPMAADKHYPEDHNFWRPHDPMVPTSYPHPHYTMTPSTLSVAPSSHSSAEQLPTFGLRDGRHWQPPRHPPLRSMSLVTPEEMPHYYQTQYQHDHTQDFSRRTTNPLEMQPPILASNAGPITEPPEQQPIPGMVPYHQTMPQQPMHFGYPPVWSSMPPLHSPHLQNSGQEGFPQEWYPHPAGLSQVKEEDQAAHFQQQQNPNYLPFQANPG